MIVMTSLLAADCSAFLLLQWEKLVRQWCEGELVVQPVPRSMMNLGAVDPEVQQPTVDREPNRPALVH